jgi:hypothetical protein
VQGEAQYRKQFTTSCNQLCSVVQGEDAVPETVHHVVLSAFALLCRVRTQFRKQFTTWCNQLCSVVQGEDTIPETVHHVVLSAFALLCRVRTQYRKQFTTWCNQLFCLQGEDAAGETDHRVV